MKRLYFFKLAAIISVLLVSCAGAFAQCNTAGSITGTPSACAGSSTTLNAVAATGGTWSSSNSSIAFVNASGLVTGLFQGTAVITYNVPNPCTGITPASVVMTVNQTPTNLVGPTLICASTPSSLTSTPSGGTWASSNTGVAAVSFLGGIAPATAGTTTITYTYSDGCYTSKTITVTPAPASITGTLVLCTGSTVALGETSSGGSWSIASSAIATVSASGLVSGLLAGNTQVSYTFPSDGCAASVTITVNATPTPYPVISAGTPSSTSYCAGSASTVHVELGNSQAGVSYKLYEGGILIDSLPSYSTGLFDFGAQLGTATYTVIALNPITQCSVNMLGSATISVNPLPTSFTVTAANNGTYCTGTAGAAITLIGSVNTVSYSLYSSASSSPLETLSGDNGSVLFGQWPMGSYTIVATDGTASRCTSTMNGGLAVTVTSEPLPPSQTITVENGGNYCSGTDGVHIGLVYSNSGITYSLFNSSGFVDSVAGANSGLDLGAQTQTGLYTVIATNQSTRCSSTMPGSATVIENYPPNLHNLTGGGSYCPGTSGIAMGLDGSDAGVSYQLYLENTPVGGAVTGTGSAVSFGTSFTTSGNYVVTATSTAGCADTMPGTLTVSVSTAPNIYSVGGGGAFCFGTTGVPIFLATSQGGVVYQLMDGPNPVGLPQFGTGSLLPFGIFTTAGTYTVVANNGCSANMSGSATVVVDPLPTADTVTGSGGYCANAPGRHVGLNFSDIGVSYQLFNSSSLPVGTALPGSGSGLDFGLQPAGSYTVIGTNVISHCSAQMAGSAVLNINPMPNIYGLSGGGNYCIGGSGEDISLDSSDNGVNYQLYLGSSLVGVALPGGADWAPVDFGLNTTGGSYYVVATSDSGCISVMSDSAVIVVNPLPNAYTLSAPGGNSYCTGGGGVDLSLSNSDLGVNYQLYQAGSTDGSPVGGTGSALDFGLQALTGAYTIVATNATTMCSVNMSGAPVVNMLPLPGVHNITGGGYYCVGGGGSLVGLDGSDAGIQYQLLFNNSPVGSVLTGTGIALNYGLQTGIGGYTIVATNVATTCTTNMAGEEYIDTASLPTVDTVSGGGPYCMGGAAPSIYLSSSTSGVTYILYRGATIVDSINVAGGALNFGSQSAAGTYTVVARDQTYGCMQNMAASATVSINTVNAYAVTGGGSYCQDGSGVHVGQTSSTSGVSYQLMVGGVNTGSPVSGTGGPIDFGLATTAGTYTVAGTNSSTGCMATMTGSVNITVSALPTQYSVTGSNSFCTGSGSATIGLSNSQSGINYQMNFGGSAVSGIVTGTGSAISFGAVTDSGAYSVIGKNTTTGCTDTMLGTATANAKPLPVAYVVSAENYGNYCAGDSGVHINLSNSQTGITYTLYRGSTLLATMPGAGAALDFGLDSVAGSYTITAYNSGTECGDTMSGSATVYIIPLPVVYDVTGTGGYCPGSSGVSVGLNGSQAGIYYQLYEGGTAVGGLVYGSGAALDFGVYPAGVYTIVGSSEVIGTSYVTTCPNPMFGSAVVVADTLSTPSATIVAYPGTGVGVWHIDSMKVFVTNAGPDPTFQWVVNGHNIAGATSATFSDYAFFNGDSVACIITSSGPCGGLSVSESVILSLYNEGVSQLNANSIDVKLAPNPNNGVFTIKGTLGTTDAGAVTLEVTDMLGQVVYSNKVMTQDGVINSQIELNSSLATGMYLLTLRSGTGSSVIHFVKE